MFKVNNNDMVNYFQPCPSVSIVNFKHAIADWVCECAYVHSPRRLHLSGSVGIPGNRSTMLR